MHFQTACYSVMLITFLALVLRVLHRLRSQSEQTPFDVATYCYMSPLLYQVLIKGGVGLTDEDDPLEQVTLALQIVRYHCSECQSFDEWFMVLS